MTVLEKKILEATSFENVYQPVFFRLSNNEDKKKFEQLIARPEVWVYSQIKSQLKELIKSQNPRKRFSDEEYGAIIEQKFNGRPADEYGVWVYYPWSGRVVHMLDEHEFIDLRTSANRQKITTAERDLLATKKVWVIGLSVGQSVSLTLAMERGCGELRLADFDTLELNNLNRIRTGVHNLGLLKAYSVAREIAELDPFFKVVCYIQGVTDETIDDFFTRGGKLDLVIDECDGVDVKILCRIKAKELQIPVLMEASDRGTLDVERFDLEPKRPIIHGWLKNLPIDLKALKNLKAPEEKLAYMLPIAGLDTLSSRMRASMIELQASITTWPQLATAVTLGGAITADTSRRIFLNQFTDSGRYFIDMENLVRDIRPRKDYQPHDQAPLLDLQEMKNMAFLAMDKLKPTSFEPEISDIRELVASAIKAPSYLNSQPWKWLYMKGYLFLFAENEEHTPHEDFNKGATYIANGAAIENLELEAGKMGIGIKAVLMPLPKNKVLVAAIQFTKEAQPQPGMEDIAELAKYISYRVTNRNTGNAQPIDSSKFAAMQAAVATIPGAALIIKEAHGDMAQLGTIMGVADRIKYLNPASHYELFNLIRWSNDECMRTGNGIHIDAFGLSAPEVIAMRMIKKQEVIRLLSEWKGGQALEYTARKNVASSSAIGLITMPDITPGNYLRAGKAIQRMWLTATKHEVAVQPMQAAISAFANLSAGTLKELPSYLKDEIAAQHEAFKNIFTEIGSNSPAFLFRLSNAAQPEVRTYRKQLEKVLFLPNNRP